MFSLPFTVKRDVLIDKPPGEVYEKVADFHTWRQWSPWLCHEPECPVEISGAPAAVGHSQRWEGQRIGVGHMSLNAAAQANQLTYDLHFLTPWKSHSKVGFNFKEEGAGTRVVWEMEGTVPVFLFFMRKMMSAWVGSDYDRGLAMLKELLESGDVPTRVDFQGEVDRDAFHYAGLRRACPQAEVGPAMEEDFKALEALVDQGHLPQPDFRFSFYHKWDFVRGACEYTACLGYRSEPASTRGPQSLVRGSVGIHRALQINHLGPYRHLGNAWSGALNALRSLKRRALKRVPMYEVYATSPGDVPDPEIQTEIFLPVR